MVKLSMYEATVLLPPVIANRYFTASFFEMLTGQKSVTVTPPFTDWVVSPITFNGIQDAPSSVEYCIANLMVAEPGLNTLAES